jgi:hypothetical protein
VVTFKQNPILFGVVSSTNLAFKNPYERDGNRSAEFLKAVDRVEQSFSVIWIEVTSGQLTSVSLYSGV